MRQYNLDRRVEKYKSCSCLADYEMSPTSLASTTPALINNNTQITTTHLASLAVYGYNVVRMLVEELGYVLAKG